MSKVAERFQEFGLTNITETVTTFMATGTGRRGERLVVEVTVIKCYGSTECRVEQPFCYVARVGTLAPHQLPSPAYSPTEVKDWKIMGTGYQQPDAESALRNALLNFEITYLDTPRARESQALAEQQRR